MFKLKKNRIDLWLPEEQKQEKGNVCRLKVVGSNDPLGSSGNGERWKSAQQNK